MAGRIDFGDEEEAAQSELLAGAMIDDLSTQHLLVGERVAGVKFRNNWTGAVDDQSVQELMITFANGVVLRATAASLDLRAASDSFRSALRAENARQRATASHGGSIRATGELLADHPGPELDLDGDPKKKLDEYIGDIEDAPLACSPDDVDESAGLRELTEGS